MRLALVFCMSLLLAAPVIGQPSPGLKRASEARSTALGTGNGKEWAKYTTEDFITTSAEGIVKTKQQRMTEIDGHPMPGSPPTFGDQQWRQYGNTVVETGQIDGSGKRTRYTTVWVKQGGTWKVAAVQQTAVSSP